MRRATLSLASTSTDNTVAFDTIAPTIALTAPNAATPLAGTVAVSANASDNVGVVGVQFLLDGAALGAEDTTTPFGVNWDTTTAANGNHVLLARARDAVGNSTDSTPLTVTVSNTQAAGFVAGYAFNESAGTTTADASGHGLTGTLVNGPTFSAGKGGGFGNAILLDGTNDFVNLGNPTALQLTGSMTISAWINSSAFPFDDAAIVSKRGDGPLIGFQLDTSVDTGPRTIGFKLTNSSGGQMIRYGATTLQANTWYYVTGVYDAAAQTMHVYLNGQLDDGVLQGTVTSTQQNSTLNVNIGQRPGSPGTYNFNGLIDDVRIYNRPLTVAQIQTDMATPVGQTSPTDPIAPQVLIDFPAAGAQASNIVNVTAAATDNAGVAGVQFFVDAVATGVEDTTDPYAFAWDTGSFTNGAHTLTALARDINGNTTLSAPVTVNVRIPAPSETRFLRPDLIFRPP